GAAIAAAIQPVVFARTEIDMMVIFPEHFVGHRGVSDRRAEVVASFDFRFDFLAEAGLSFGGLDCDLELRLLILLDAKERARVVLRDGAVAVDLEVIDAQRRLVPELKFSLSAAE